MTSTNINTSSICQDQNKTTFCALPFMAVDCHNGVRKPCCMNQDRDWKMFNNLDQYWHSSTLARIRHNLLNNIRDPSCQYCWDIEDKGHESMRQAVAKSRSYIPKTDSPPSIKQVKLITGRTCNLACMMCFDTVSSTYKKLWKTDISWVMPIQKRIRLDYDVEMDSYIRKNAHSLEFIEVLGGEPLFDKRFMELIDYLIKIGANNHMTLFIITNGTIFTHKIKQKFKKFKKTVFVVSVDGVGLINDYQRWPSIWSDVKKNIEIINDNFDMTIMPTLTAINIIGLPHLRDFCDVNNYSFGNLNVVQHWPELLPCNLPLKLKTLVSEEYRCLLDGPSDPKKLIAFIQRWDHQRNIKIQDYMPEWHDIL